MAQKEPVSLRTVLAGFRFIREKKLILGSISLDMFAVLLGGAKALLPIYARTILHTGPWGLGLLRSAPGAGAALIAIVVAHRPIHRRAGPTMLFAVAAFGVFTIVFGISHILILSLAALFLTGAADMVSVIIRATLIQVAMFFGNQVRQYGSAYRKTETAGNSDQYQNDVDEVNRLRGTPTDG